MKIIDLSHKIYNRMPVYPGDADVLLSSVRDLDADGYNAAELLTGMHAGTHIDAPLHFFDSLPGSGDRCGFVGDLPLDSFYGRGRLIDLRGFAEAGGTFGIGAAEYIREVSPGEIVLIRTGHEELYGRPEYYSSQPSLDVDFVKLLAGRGIKMLGIDMPSPDKFPFEAHKFLLENKIPVLENLANLGELQEAGASEFFVSALPLRITAEASIVRAAAIIE